MKRSRMEMSDARVKKAMAIASRIKSKYPYSDFGRAYFKRGSSQSLRMFGKSYKDASTKQRASRKALGYVGRGKYIGRGRGNYVVENSIVKGGQTAFAVPQFSDKGTTITVSHREYIRNVYAPQNPLDFQVDTVTINPGLPQSFPWLSQIASNYEEYSLKQCIYTFRSTVDVSTATGQCGQVIMATQYNVTDDPFSDKLSMMTYDMAQSCKTTEHMLHGVECDPKLNSGAEGKYVRVSSLQLDQDYKEYDQGILNVAIADIPSTFAGQSMGELWVTYTVELRKPKLLSNYGLALQKYVAFSAPSGNYLSYVGFPPLVVFDNVGSGATLVDPSAKYAVENSLPVSLSYDSAPMSCIPTTNANQAYTNNLPGGLLLTFAPYYSGQIRLCVKVAYKFNELTGPVVGNASMGFGWNGLIQVYTGNISKIMDVADVDIQTAITAGPTPATTFSAGWHSGQLEQNFWSFRGEQLSNNSEYWCGVFTTHIDVKAATNGVANTIKLNVNHCNYTTDQTLVAAVNFPTIFSSLELEEYNSGFRIKTNGSNDRLALVDENGNPTSFP